MGKNTSSKEFPTPVESRDRKDKKVNEKKQTNKKDRIKNIAIVFLVIMLLLTFFSNTIMNYSLPEVSATYAQNGSVTAKVRGTGTVETAEDYDVKVTENHVVGSVKIKVGDEVSADQLLFELDGTGTTDETALKEAQDTLDSLELDYSKALLAAAPNYALDNLEIKSAREELSDAVANQTKAAARASLVEQQAAAQKKVNDLQADVDYIQAQIDSSVSGNSVSKYNKKLKEKKYREETNCYIIEGIKLVKEAIEENAKIKYILICEDCDDAVKLEQNLLYDIAKNNCLYVTKKLFLSISDVTTPQGVLAVIEKKKGTEQIDYNDDIIVALDGIQDPGNLGTILRTVDSANLKQIILSKDCADAYNPKVVRSTMGAIFRVNIIEAENLAEILKEIKKHNFDVVVTSLETEESIYNLEYKNKIIVIGNEANGVSEEILKLADIKVKIPMLGKTESLNASVATGIMLYEYVRQKIKK